MTKKDKLIDALNRLDYFACEFTMDNNYMEDMKRGECDQVGIDYNLLFDFITKAHEKTVKKVSGNTKKKQRRG